MKSMNNEKREGQSERQDPCDKALRQDDNKARSWLEQINKIQVFFIKIAYYFILEEISNYIY